MVLLDILATITSLKYPANHNGVFDKESAEIFSFDENNYICIIEIIDGMWIYCTRECDKNCGATGPLSAYKSNIRGTRSEAIRGGVEEILKSWVPKTPKRLAYFKKLINEN